MELAALVAGSGWASGLNLYAVLLVVGVAGRLDVATVPDALQRPEVLVVAGILYAVEFVIDKIPWLDSAWDVLHTVIRPIGGAAVAALVAGEATTLQQAIATASGGLLSLAGHAAKSSVRAAVNTSPEPASNIIVSLLEDVLVVGLVLLALSNPVLALTAVAILTILGVVVTVLLVKTLRTTWQRLAERRAQRAGTRR